MKSCFTCKHRSDNEENYWTEMPKYKCGNGKSFRHNRLVLKGMICSEHEPKKSWKEQVA